MVRQEGFFPGIWGTNVVDDTVYGFRGTSTRASSSIERIFSRAPMAGDADDVGRLARAMEDVKRERRQG